MPVLHQQEMQNSGHKSEDDDHFVNELYEFKNAQDDARLRKKQAKSLKTQGKQQQADFLLAESEYERCPTEEGKKKLLQLAEGLDPVWVAIVSRLPFGVCRDWGDQCKPILFGEARAVIESQLDELKANYLGVDVPPPYHAYLLMFNGGSPWPPDFRSPGQFYAEGDSEELRFFLELTGGPETDPGFSLERHIKSLQDVRSDLAIWASRPHVNVIPIGIHGQMKYTQPGVVYLGLGGQEEGHVFFTLCHGTTYDHRDVRLEHVAPSFTSFLSLLTDHSPAYVRAIRGGDVAPLRQWLEEGGSANSLYRCVPLLDHAIMHRHPEAVRELLANGANGKDRLFFAESGGCQEVIDLLRSAKR